MIVDELPKQIDITIFAHFLSWKAAKWDVSKNALFVAFLFSLIYYNNLQQYPPNTLHSFNQIIKMKQLPKPPAILFIFIQMALFLSCSKKDIEFGNDMGETFTKIQQIDTVSVHLSTFVQDSFVTSSINEFIAGSYRDSLLGTIKAKAFVQLLPALGAELADDAVFDSLSFVVKWNGYYYGDTTQLQTITINELAAPIAYTYSSYIYNTSSFADKPVPLGAKSSFIYPTRGDSVIVRLSQSKGQELFDKIKQKDVEMQTADAFLQYFNGVSINISSPSPSAVYGFKMTADTIYMRLHYHTLNPLPENKFLDFHFYNNLYSNQIITDRTGTTMSGLINNEISASRTGNQAFAQSGTGVLLKMTFPTLRNILQLDTSVRLLKANLVLKVPKGSFDGKSLLPEVLYFAQTDASNSFGAFLTNPLGEFIAAIPTYDYLYGGATTYTVDLTTSINELMRTGGSENNGLFLFESPPGAAGRINRAIINSSAAAIDPSQLVLSLLIINADK